MWKQTYYELRKLLSQPFLAVLLLFTILIHGILCCVALYLPNGDAYSCVQEVRMWNLLTSETPEEQLEEVGDLRSALLEADFSELSEEGYAHWYGQHLILEQMKKRSWQLIT